MGEDIIITIHFQAWRPCGGDCYSLVRKNVFSSITFVIGGSVSVTPQPTNVISVRPGDVLGYFVSSSIWGTDPQGIQLNADFTNDLIYYADLDRPLTAQCQ